MDTDGAGAPDARNAQVDNAIRAIQEKKPLPEIDFSIHRMEDGTEVNTAERVCKGKCHRLIAAYYINRVALPLDQTQPHATLLISSTPW